MTSVPNERTFDVRGAVVVALIAFTMYAIGLGASDLTGDPLKYAIDISYPHPPLFRGAMWWAQVLFGQTAFWARVPMVALASFAGGLGWMLFRYVGLSRVTAAFLIGGLLLMPSWATVVREGYLGSGLAFSWLLGIIGAIQLERERSVSGLLLLFTAVTLGLWGQIQNLWLLPALTILGWRLRDQWFHWGPWERALFVLIPFNIVIWGAYILTNPLIVGDMLFFATDRPRAGLLVPSISIMTLSLVIFALWGYRLASHKRISLAEWEWTGGILCLTVVPLVLYNPVHWYVPYLWACLVMALASAARTISTRQQWITVPLAFLLAFGAWNAWVVTQPYHALVPQIQERLGDATDLIILGAHGYEWEYYLFTVNHRLPADVEIRSAIPYAIAPNPASLTAEERAWAAQQTLIDQVGPIHVYAISNP